MFEVIVRLLQLQVVLALVVPAVGMVLCNWREVFQDRRDK